MARKRERLTDDGLMEILRKEEQAASLYQWSKLRGTQVDALKYYDRELYGDEQEGASSVVTSEFQDTIESMMPGLMRMFTGTDQVAEFAPSAPGEEPWAREASSYVPHVFMRQNDGFRILHWLIKDALMYRLGAVTIDLEPAEDRKRVPVQGLPQEAINVIEATAELEGSELDMDLAPDRQKAAKESVEYGKGMGSSRCKNCAHWMDGTCELVDGQVKPMSWCRLFEPRTEASPPPQPDTFSGTISVTRATMRVIADNIAPEDILFTPSARDQDKASFLGYRKRATASDLVEMGLAPDEVDELRSDRDISAEAAERDDGEVLNDTERDQIGDSERSLWLVVAYVRADVDGDGVSEMLRVIYAHAGGTVGRIIEQVEWEGPASIALASPILMSHKIVGRSIFDQVQDLQEICSVLTRGMLDNMYIVNRPRPVVSDEVVLDTLLDWVPGTPIRLKPNANLGENHVNWLTVPSITGNVLQGLEYFQSVRENRTGVVRNNQGLDAESLNKTATGMNMLMGAAQQRPELIARVLAETAIKRIYMLVYRAIKRAASGPVKYWSGQAFATVDPTKWPDEMALTVDVGSGSKDLAVQQLAMIAQSQEKLIALQGGKADGPFVTAENVANLVQRVSDTLGFRTPLFFQPPEKVAAQPPQPQQPPQDPNMVAAQAMIAIEQAKADAEIKIRRDKAGVDIQLEQQKAAARLEIMREEASLKIDLQEHQANLDAGVEVHKAELKAATDAHSLAITREEAASSEQEGQSDGGNPRSTSPAPPRRRLGDTDPALLQAIQALASGQAQMAQHIGTLGEGLKAMAAAHMSDTEVTTSGGKTLRARRIPRHLQ